MNSTATLIKDLRFRTPRGLPGLLEKSCRERVLRAFAAIRVGSLTVTDSFGTYTFGNDDADEGLSARVLVFDSRTYVQVGLRGGVGAGESYMDARWSCDDLTALARILLRNDAAMQSIDGAAGAFAAKMMRYLQRSNRNTLRGSRRNISRHYDLGNDFYSLWLDDSMTYSCALFAEGDDLAQAQERKYEAIADALELSDEHSLLEIGCGWGGFAVYAAQTYGCHVTATTISREQYRIARQRVVDAGLGDRVEIILQDYRELQGKFDRIVSIEMFEAVGHEYQETFFDVCQQRLRAGGRMLLQTITISEDRYGAARERTDFIQRYIFPGGALPSVQSLTSQLQRTAGLSMVKYREIGHHYARTLELWRERFRTAGAEIARQGFDSRFVRMWEFYLCYCEAGFRERSIGTVHVLIERTPGGR